MQYRKHTVRNISRIRGSNWVSVVLIAAAWGLLQCFCNQTEFKGKGHSHVYLFSDHNVKKCSITRDIIKALCLGPALGSHRVDGSAAFAGEINPFVFFLFTFPQAVATKLDLPEDLVGYFSLFLIREGPDSSLTCECQVQLSQSVGQNKSTSLPRSYPSALGCVDRRSDGWFSFFFFPAAEIHQIVAVLTLRRQRKCCGTHSLTGLK